MKTLYLLTHDGGDGSVNIHYTFNKEFIDRLETKDEAGELEYGDLGVDGDGFGYKTLTVPDECTLESLGISSDVAEED